MNILSVSLPTVGVNMFHTAGQLLLSFSAKVAREIDRGGFSKEALKERLWETARYNVGWLRRSGLLVEGEGHMYYWGHGVEDPPNLSSLPDDAMVPMVETPEDIHVAVVGGDSQWFVGFSAGWGNYGGYAVTKPINTPGT